MPSHFPLSTSWFAGGRGPARSLPVRGSRRCSASRRRHPPRDQSGATQSRPGHAHQTRRDGTPSRLKIRQSFPQERLSGKAIEEVAHRDRGQKTEDRGQDHSEKQKAESRKQKWHYKTARLWDYG